MRRFLYITWRDYGSQLVLLFLVGVLWFFFGLVTYGCAEYQPTAPDGCDVDLAAITASCTAKIELCQDATCVDDTQAQCDREIEQACK